MSTRNKFLAGGLVALLAVVAVVWVRSSGDEGGDTNLIITPRLVERRDLNDVLTVSGEVRRDETRKINSAVDGKVSSISVADGDTIEEGDAILALDGRTSVAVAGDFFVLPSAERRKCRS